MSAEQVRVPATGGVLYVLYDAAGARELVELLNSIVTGSPPRAACRSVYAELSQIAATMNGYIVTQRMSSTRPTVNGYTVDRKWAGGCWFTTAQGTKLADLNRRWNYVQSGSCAEVATSEPVSKLRDVLLQDAVADAAEPEVGYTSVDQTAREAGFTITKGEAGTADDDTGAVSDDTSYDDGTTITEEETGMSTSAKLALGAGVLLAVVLIVRGLK